MRLCALGTVGVLLMLSACATSPPPVTDSQAYPGCQSSLTSDRPAAYRCSITPAERATVTEKAARNGSPYFQIVIDRSTSTQLSALDGRELLQAYERHCESPRQLAEDIRFNQRVMVETELTCLVDRTLHDGGHCPHDWYWVNRDGSAPLSTAPAKVEGDHWVTYVACHSPEGYTTRYAWPKAGAYLIIDYTSLRFKNSLACLDPTQCASGERIGFRGSNWGFDLIYGHHLNPYLALEGGLLFAGPNTTNDLARTANEISTYLDGYGAVRAGLRAQYPIASRATLFARYAAGYQWASFVYGNSTPFSDPVEASASHWMQEFAAGAECRLAGPLILRASYTPSLTNGGLTRSAWSVGFVYAQ